MKISQNFVAFSEYMNFKYAKKVTLLVKNSQKCANVTKVWPLSCCIVNIFIDLWSQIFVEKIMPDTLGFKICHIFFYKKLEPTEDENIIYVTLKI